MDASVNRIPSSKDERAYCISLRNHNQHVTDAEYSLNELKMLIKTAGGIIVGSKIVRRDKLDPAYIVGKGFLDKLRKIVSDNDIKLLVFDLNNLKPAQVRNLEETLKCRVIGRTEVILDIFARRARSSEARIQVELAQLKYILPRLKGLGGVLSRLGGGIGTRGPGEKMLETDRRHIQKRISTLNKKLDKIASHRKLIRKNRVSRMFMLERPLENLYRIYEYFFLLSRYQDYGKIYLMHSLVTFTEEMVYLWHYITFKLQCQLSPASMILRHEKDIILLFADISDVDIVESFFNTIQDIFPGMITFNAYDNREFSHSMGLLRKIEKL